MNLECKIMSNINIIIILSIHVAKEFSWNILKINNELLENNGLIMDF